MEKHINNICAIVSRNIGVIHKLKTFFPQGILCTLYNTLILPYLTYGILAWGNCGVGQTNRILRLQKKVIRIINSGAYLEHSSPLFYTCKAPRFDDIYSLNLGTLMH